MSTSTQPRRSRKLQAQRLSDLLARRAAIGAEWAERTSHGLPSGEQLLELSTVERALTEGWPHLAEKWLTSWIVADAGRLHGGSDNQIANCRYCEHDTATRAA